MTTGPDARRQRGRRPLVRALLPAVALGVGFIAGPRVFGGGTGPQQVPPATTSTTHAGAIVQLDSVVLNLADGRLLKVALAVQQSAAWEEANDVDASADDVDAADRAAEFVPVQDAAVVVFSRRGAAELLSRAGREGARTELETMLAERYGDRIEALYFTQFVIQ